MCLWSLAQYWLVFPSPLLFPLPACGALAVYIEINPTNIAHPPAAAARNEGQAGQGRA